MDDSLARPYRADQMTGHTFDRSFDYDQHVLLMVEFGAKPHELGDMPAGYSVFRRLPTAELAEAYTAHQQGPPNPAALQQFEQVQREHMSYWEQRVPAGQQCFVHYAIGAQPAVAEAFQRAKADSQGWALAGTYHLEPQSSAYPFGFPAGPVPDHWGLGKVKICTDDSVFWFNFFPAQDYLFEKTFVVWTHFCLSQLEERGECNQLVASDGKECLQVQGVDEFVQVNLNRFTNLNGYFGSARAAGETTFTVDSDYRWYGMLLRKL
jgi:hypothetical protein